MIWSTQRYTNIIRQLHIDNGRLEHICRCLHTHQVNKWAVTGHGGILKAVNLLINTVLFCLAVHVHMCVPVHKHVCHWNLQVITVTSNLALRSEVISYRRMARNHTARLSQCQTFSICMCMCMCVRQRITGTLMTGKNRVTDTDWETNRAGGKPICWIIFYHKWNCFHSLHWPS